MRIGCSVKDHRTIAGKRLRKSEILPLQQQSKDPDEICYHEAQISSICWGPDDSFWTEIFLVDTFFGSELYYEKYLDPVLDPGTNLVLRLDPPTLKHNLTLSSDPREYWLTQLDVRLTQVVHEYTALVGTFSKRMESYVRTPEFMSDRSGHTQTLSDVLETIQNFSDSISSTIDAWESFRRTQNSFFSPEARSNDANSIPTYSRLFNGIIQSIGELERLRSLLLTQRAKFKSRIENYVAFPLLFTAAIFSMDFVKPKSDNLAWGLFSTVFAVTSVLNGTIAWLLHKSLIQKAAGKLLASSQSFLRKLPALIQSLFSKALEWIGEFFAKLVPWIGRASNKLFEWWNSL
ncbi:hypothetical protein P171DRAFT_354948 [Karstenula rhodostoma CBS 690.94]|uniref:Uncharacterized protein n=1 Tax=Karstenula rhodostoma CBS 690.94 TaxID=1392251 RepID=A0A9P4PS15_9PLEO|nr:hypothetical protein P171DRAFT_354948 [Karstenula rhodostoma CBS 690.94]